MDLTKPLKPGVWVDGPYGSFFQHAEYEGLSSFCFRCGHIGHKEPWCPNKGLMHDKNSSQPTLEVNGGMPHSAACGVENVDHRPSSSTANHPSGLGDGGQQGSTLASSSVALDNLAKDMPRRETVSTVAPVLDGVDNRKTSSHGLGPWMLVTKKKGPPRGGRGGTSKSNVQSTRMKDGSPAQAMGVAQGSKPHTHQSHGQPIRSRFGRFPVGSGSAIVQRDSHQVKDATLNDGSRSTVFNFGEALPNSGDAQEIPAVRSPQTRSGRERLSKAFVEREVNGLGPVTEGGRKKRRQRSHNDGGDTSLLVN